MPRRDQRTSQKETLWRILLKQVNANNFTKARTINQESYKLQVFELLATETLSLLVKDLDFTVTRSNADEGIDFVARGHSYQAPILKFHLETIIKGQVKRRQNYSKLIEAIINNFRSISKHAKLGLTAYIFVYSTEKKINPTVIKQKLQQEQVDRFYNGPVVYLDAEEFFEMWRHNPRFVKNILHGGLSSEEVEQLINLIDERGTKAKNPSILGAKLEVTQLSDPIVSRVFRLSVVLSNIHFSFPGDLFLRWNALDGIRLKRPIGLVREPGVPFPLDLGSSIVLELVPDRAGDCDLGYVQLIDANGLEWANISLDTVTVAPGPPFVDPPEYKDAFEAQRKQLDLAGQQAKAKHPTAVIVTGHGGVGKTKLIENVLIGLEAEGFAFETIEHEASLDVDRPFLRDLLRWLTRVPETGTGTKDKLLEWAERTIMLGRSKFMETIKLLYSSDGTISCRDMAELLFAALADRTRRQPVALHLSNLHWAGSLEIGAIEELLRILCSKDIRLLSGVLLILEGRTAEQLFVKRDYRAPEAWERLLTINLCKTIALHAWDDTLSRGFLSFVLDTIRFVGPSGERDRIIEWALRLGTGNPMHLLECLRALPWFYTEDGGSALKSPPASSPQRCAWIDPVEVRPERTAVHAIDLRLRFAAEAYPHAVSALAVVARFGAVVEPAIWQRLCSVTDQAALERDIRALDMVDLSMESRGVRFRHENYHRVFLDWQVPESCPFRKAILEWIAQQSNPTANQIIGEADLLTSLGDPDEATRDYLLARLDSSQFPLEGLARAAMLRFTLRLSRGLLDQGMLRSYQLRHELARSLIAAQDWRQAQEELEAIIEDIDRDDENNAVLIRAKVAASLGNMLGDLPQTSRGLTVVRNAIEEAQIRLGATPTEPAVQEALETLWNRFGILHWFEGRPEEGTQWQWRAFRSARRNDRGGAREMLFTNEFAMPLLHRNPQRSKNMLAYAAALVDRLGDSVPSTSDYILVQSEIANLVTANWQGENHLATDVLESCRRILLRPKSKRSVYGQALGHLTAGAAAALQANLEASEGHFIESAWIAKQSTLSRVLWKAELNLAQILRRRAPNADVSGRIAAVSETLTASLAKVSDSARTALVRTWELPMRHCLRLDSHAAESVGIVLGNGPPSWGPDWTQRPPCYSKSGEPMQIIHVRDSEDDYFLMA
jgi:hypothetical protein